MKWRVCVLIALWASAAGAQDAAPLDRNAAIAKGGNMRVFADYAARPYVYLCKDVRLRMELAGWRRNVHHLIAITNASGRDRGTLQYSFHESLKFKVSGATITSNNMRLDLGKGGVQTKKLGHFVQYTILFPNVTEGSILDLRYEIRGEWRLTYDESRIAEAQPVLYAKVTIDDPDELGAVVAARNIRSEQRVGKHEDEKARRTTFEFFNVPATHDESLAPPPDVYWPMVTVYARNGRNWNWMALNEEPFFRFAFDLAESDAAKKLLEARIGKETDPAKRCAAVLQFVRNEIQLVGGGEWSGLYPTAATETLEGRTGSAMDVAGLAVGLMRKAGLEVRVALVRRGTSGDWSGTVYKALQFDRFLPYVKLDDGWHWLDPVCKTCGFDDLDASYCGTTAILFQSDVGKDIDAILDGAKNAESQGAWAQQVQAAIHNAHWTDIVPVCPARTWLDAAEYEETLEVSIDTLGALHGDLDVAITGQRKLALRAELLEMPESARTEWFAKRLSGRIPGAVVESARYSGLEPDLARGGSADTLRVQAKVAVPHFMNGDRFALTANLFAVPIRDPLQPGPRKFPIWLGRAGCERNLVVLHLPDGMRCDRLPDPVLIQSDAVRYQSAFAEVDGTLQFQREYAWSRGSYEPAAAAGIHSTYAAVEKAEARRVEFVPAAADAGER